MQPYLLYFIGLIAGIISAVRHYTLADVSIMIVALIRSFDAELLDGSSTDSMVCRRWWIGCQNFMKMRPSGWGDSWRQIILPVVTLGTGGAAIIARMTRSSMLEVIGQDYIRTAEQKG